MEHQIFCDGIGRIAVIDGVVRLDLFAYSPTETDANGNPRPVLSHRVVMSLDGFLRSSEKVIEAVRLIDRARQQQQQPAAPQPARPVPTPAPQAARPPAPPAPPPSAPKPVEPPPPVKPPFP